MQITGEPRLLSITLQSFSLYAKLNDTNMYLFIPINDNIKQNLRNTFHEMYV